MKKYAIYLAIGILIFLLPAVSAQQGHMKLLAVTETSEGYKGGIADLYLDIRPGSGRVFLETFPLTKIDTQVSTRFAKEIACDFADIDCDQFDFFYTITADSSIIAGPSAGAAISVLTFSLIKDIDFDENVAITGTINSGGLIGPVGGLTAKIEAANKTGLNKVLIPIGESVESDKNESANESFGLEDLRKKYGLEIIEVSTLDEAIFEFTGKRFREKKANLTISQDYAGTMKNLAMQLCSRSTKLKKGISNLIILDNGTKKVLDNAINLSNKGKDSFAESKYYSSASYCFGANVEFNYLSLLQQDLTESEISEQVENLDRDIKNFDKEIESREIKTITALEAYMVVKERLLESSNFLNLVNETADNKNISLHNLAYAIERINSAYSWSEFFGTKGKEFNFNDEIIKNACKTKLSEVEERLQYVQLYFSQGLENTQKELDYAYQDLKEGNYELCLFKASTAKANVDAILSVFGVKNDNIDIIISNKLSVVERNLVEENEKGVFPILGYSYFEYANSLRDSDTASALLYAEYALELSNLNIYFKSPESKKMNFYKRFDKKLLIVLLTGIIIGIFATKIFELKGIKKDKRMVKVKARRK